ncbi:hypothetical protein [Muribaculum sp. NM65_B17]|uniref:hypothetical protein n=1 Tax=Muribaculum sp. NM65_B17 TaxID=2516961 RepID=UPI001093DF40|nr:hypothetical protein [Muribaculum sp. NM65_B17]TGY04148.1 hypothetical protein E5354_07715 [Muribaculum sp. NM65_B17]THG43193.1 hypothetical protein E5985_06675 [Muribaculaceae bacterium]
MKKFLYSLMAVVFAAFSFALTSCGDDDDEPDDVSTSTSTTVTFDNSTYTVGTAFYLIDTENDAYGFVATIKAESGNKTVFLYYDRFGNSLERGTKLDPSRVHIVVRDGAGNVSGSQVALKVTTVLNGDITVVDYSEGCGLKFNNFRFETSDNEGTTYSLNGTINYDYKRL